MTWPNPSNMPPLEEMPGGTGSVHATHPIPRGAPASTNGTLDLSDALLHVTYQGTNFALDLIEANDALDDIAEQVKKAGEAAAGEPGEKWLWLRLFQEWVAEHGAPPMRPQALHALWHKVRYCFFEVERQQNAELAAFLGSPPSTPASTLAA